jgi:hypothetical protein
MPGGLLNKILYYFDEPIEQYRTYIKSDFKGLKKWHKFEYYSSYKILLIQYFSRQELKLISLCESRKYKNILIDYKKVFYYLLYYRNLYKEKNDDMNGFLDGFWGIYQYRRNKLISKILKFLPNDIITEIKKYGI